MYTSCMRVLTWRWWIYQAAMSLCSSPSASSLHLHPPSQPRPPYGDVPAIHTKKKISTIHNIHKQTLHTEMLHSELCRHCQTETSAMPYGKSSNCPSLRLSTPATLLYWLCAASKLHPQALVTVRGVVSFAWVCTAVNDEG